MDIWKELGLKEEVQKAIAEDRSGSFTMAALVERHYTKNTLFVAELTMVGSWYIWWQGRQIVKRRDSPTAAPNRHINTSSSNKLYPLTYT